LLNKYVVGVNYDISYQVMRLIVMLSSGNRKSLAEAGLLAASCTLSVVNN